ncbi:MAG: MOSC domain-containing protein [Pseudomonadota bacterium]
MQGMRIRSVNVGAAQPLTRGERSVVTGICKRPVVGAVRVSAEGVAGDTICDTENHGGIDQAVYAYGVADYAWWGQELGRSLEPGTFGENLTIDGLPEDLHAGDRLLIGDVILEATSPRIPCRTFAMRMDDRHFGLKFRDAARPGFYFRVLNEGELQAGDSVTIVEDPASEATLLDQFHLRYSTSPDRETLERVLATPIATRMREMFEAKLEAIS